MAYTTIDDPTIYFNTVLYTGNFSTQSITGVGFQPDWVWIKERSVSGNHQLQNSVNGTNSKLMSNSTSAEGTDTNYITSFDSDGFSLGANNGNNQSGVSNVAWNWKAGTTSGISGSPSITPSGYSFSQTAGFSIIAYTGNASVGATIPHGLGVAPAVIIFKNRDSSVKWAVYHHKNTSAPETDHLQLNDTTATSDDDSILNDTAPGSSVITMKTSSSVNSNSAKYVAFCFSEIKGYSKHGSYTGNGNTNGTFVYTGFKPAWVMIKRTDGSNGWFIMDNKRLGFNSGTTNSATLGNVELNANTNRSEAEGNTNMMDLLSNGFKCRQSGSDSNTSGGTYIYMAFAHSPFTNSNGVPTNAR